eukprot:6951938-Pyramimonas_sp.AAC.1
MRTTKLSSIDSHQRVCYVALSEDSRTTPGPRTRCRPESEASLATRCTPPPPLPPPSARGARPPPAPPG